MNTPPQTTLQILERLKSNLQGSANGLRVNLWSLKTIGSKRVAIGKADAYDHAAKLVQFEIDNLK